MSDVPVAARAALAKVPATPHAVTIGNFDGVHRGHRYLVEQVVARARAEGVRALVITFEPHPTAVLRPDVPFERLTAAEEKLRLLRAAGADDIAVIPFDRDFAALSPVEFLEWITQATRPVAVYVGEGFRFGHQRAGSGETIREFGSRAGFDTVVLERIRDDDLTISSSTVRAALKAGDLVTAERALGRRYRLRGTVEHGAARGRELGYPTANLQLPPDACVPMDGIYAAYAHVETGDLGPRQAMVYIGPRPTFDNGSREVEVNILDFSGDLYTLSLEVEFVAFIRSDRAFDSVGELIEQIGRDERATRALLSGTRPEPT